jgi:hypothetical protein
MVNRFPVKKRDISITRANNVSAIHPNYDVAARNANEAQDVMDAVRAAITEFGDI